MAAAPARCKLVLVGDVQCGKTAMLQVLAKDCYPEVSRRRRHRRRPSTGRRRRERPLTLPVPLQTYVPTVFENYTACLASEEQRVELSLWDTSGTGGGSEGRAPRYRGAARGGGEGSARRYRGTGVRGNPPVPGGGESARRYRGAGGGGGAGVARRYRGAGMRGALAGTGGSPGPGPGRCNGEGVGDPYGGAAVTGSRRGGGGVDLVAAVGTSGGRWCGWGARGDLAVPGGHRADPLLGVAPLLVGDTPPLLM